MATAPASQPDPHHVAIIMDGNGRWAAKRGLPREAGHRAGADAVERTVTAARELGLRVLTLYAFSADNWRRPAGEVRHLMLVNTRRHRSGRTEASPRRRRVRGAGPVGRRRQVAERRRGDQREREREGLLDVHDDRHTKHRRASTVAIVESSERADRRIRGDSWPGRAARHSRGRRTTKMGVPAFFRYMTEKYPKIIEQLVTFDG